jgi:anti-sigma factor RsiW
MDLCVSLDQMERLLDERLDERQHQAVEDHVEGCRNCQQRLEEFAVARNEARSRVPSGPGPGEDEAQAGFLPGLTHHSRMIRMSG